MREGRFAEKLATLISLTGERKVMPTGLVKTWIEDRGFGFIAPDEGGADVFCHAKSLIGCSVLTPGAAVEYDAQFDRQRGKWHAVDCRVI